MAKSKRSRLTLFYLEWHGASDFWKVRLSGNIMRCKRIPVYNPVCLDHM